MPPVCFGKTGFVCKKFFYAGSGLNNGSEETKIAVLISSLNAEDARVACDLTDANASYDEVIKRLSERFGDRQSVIYARTRFARRIQNSEEDILSYVTELRRLASYCKFNAVELENVRDRLVARCHDDKISEKLLLEPETITLDAAIVLAQNVELASSESK